MESDRQILKCKPALQAYRLQLFWGTSLTLLLQKSLTYWNQSINLQSKSMDWFLYDKDVRHERVKG